MERFIPTEISGKKVIPSKVLLFSRFDRFNRNFLYHLFALLVPGSSARARTSLHRATEMLFVDYSCCFSFNLLADFLAHNCEITGKSDGCFRT